MMNKRPEISRKNYFELFSPKYEKLGKRKVYEKED
jgi:hypothetical protein